MKKLICLFCVLLLMLGLLSGCFSKSASAPTASPGDRSTPIPAPDSEVEELTDPAAHDSTGAEASATDAGRTEAPETEAPVTETPETEAPEPEPSTEEAAAAETDPPADEAPIFVQVADYFTNGLVEIRDEDGIISRKDLEAGTETILFRLEKNDAIETQLFGVTDERLYFGWNEVEDWWGYNVYSVDYRGENRVEYGGAWDPMFDGGWLILYGFRSDVSATELRVIDRDDMLVVDLENVWDGIVAEDGCFYFVYGGELPEEIGEWFAEHEERDVEFKVLKLTPEGDFSVHGSLFFKRYYEPCFINFTTIGFPEAGEYYDLYTLEPTEEPVYG